MADDEIKKSKNDINRKRMEEVLKAKKVKKGFMTPKRRQKLRPLLRKKTHEEYKKEQERKAVERKHTIKERCGKATDLRSANEETLKSICNQYHSKIATLENDKYDLEYIVATKDMEINHLDDMTRYGGKVELRTGRFFWLVLKKVNNYENKLAKLQCKTSSFQVGNILKVVKKIEFTLADNKGKEKPEWSKNKGDAKADV